MKTQSNLSFLKGASLAGLAVAALSATISLTACGGGSGSEASTVVEKAAIFMQGKTLTLQGPTTACTAQLAEHIKGTGIIQAQIRYGASAPSNGYVTIRTIERMTEDAIVEGTIGLPIENNSATNSNDFKAWWGITGNGTVVFTADNHVRLKDGYRASSNVCVGNYETVCTFTNTNQDGTTGEPTEQTIQGSFFRIE